MFRPRADVLGARELVCIFEVQAPVLVLEIKEHMGNVLVLAFLLNVLRFYEYISVPF